MTVAIRSSCRIDEYSGSRLLGVGSSCEKERSNYRSDHCTNMDLERGKWERERAEQEVDK